GTGGGGVETDRKGASLCSLCAVAQGYRGCAARGGGDAARECTCAARGRALTHCGRAGGAGEAARPERRAVVRVGRAGIADGRAVRTARGCLCAEGGRLGACRRCAESARKRIRARGRGKGKATGVVADDRKI